MPESFTCRTVNQPICSKLIIPYIRVSKQNGCGRLWGSRIITAACKAAVSGSQTASVWLDAQAPGQLSHGHLLNLLALKLKNETWLTLQI